ncbi:MAG: hypothetical protein WCH78_01380 [Bacteroidota bacterium]
MKNYIILICLLILGLNSQSQSVYDNVNLKMMLYPKFQVSEVYLKNGRIVEVGLNYNLERHQLIFIEDKQYKELAGLETIDSVLVLGKSFDSEANKEVVTTIKFVPINEKIYQCTEYNGLYILYDYSVTPTDFTADHNGAHKSETSESSNTITGANSLKVYKNNNNVNMIPLFSYYDKNTMIEIRQSKQLANAFKVDKALLNGYIGQTQVNIYQLKDAIRLIEWLKKKSKQN